MPALSAAAVSRWPVQLFSRHGARTLCPFLNFSMCLDVVGCEGIPDRAGILWHRLQGCFICCIFQPLIGGLDVLPEEAHGLVDFVADISDVSIPLEVRGDFNSKIFWLGFCAKSVTITMELVL